MRCYAFGRRYRQSSSDVFACVDCSDGIPLLPIVLVSTVAAVALAALFAFVAWARRASGAAQQRLSTITLIVSHVQSVAILGSLPLGWPAIVQAVLNAVSFRLPKLIPQAECFLGSSDDLFWLFSVLQCAALLILLLLSEELLQSARLAEHPDADGWQLAQSVLFTLQFVPALDLCLGVMAGVILERGALSAVAGAAIATAALLLAAQVALAYLPRMGAASS